MYQISTKVNTRMLWLPYSSAPLLTGLCLYASRRALRRVVRACSCPLAPTHPAFDPPLSPSSPQTIIEKEGVQGLFLRGLGTKLITNGIQGILFSVLWRLGQVGSRKGDSVELRGHLFPFLFKPTM